MKIKIKLYGDMKQYAPGADTEFPLNAAPGALFEQIINRLAIPKSGYVSLVNGRRVDETYCFEDGDTLVLFPEISGG